MRELFDISEIIQEKNQIARKNIKACFACPYTALYNLPGIQRFQYANYCFRSISFSFPNYMPNQAVSTSFWPFLHLSQYINTQHPCLLHLLTLLQAHKLTMILPKVNQHPNVWKPAFPRSQRNINWSQNHGVCNKCNAHDKRQTYLKLLVTTLKQIWALPSSISKHIISQFLRFHSDHINIFIPLLAITIRLSCSSISHLIKKEPYVPFLNAFPIYFSNPWTTIFKIVTFTL